MKLFGQCEKEQLKAMVNLMVAHNISYGQQRQPDGQFAYEFEPWVKSTATWHLGLTPLH